MKQGMATRALRSMDSETNEGCSSLLTGACGGVDPSDDPSEPPYSGAPHHSP